MKEQTAYRPRRLVLVARRFPFNHGEVAAESYLETEIGYLASYFDEVLAVGTEASCGDEPTCALPANVVPLALGCGCAKKDKARLALRGLGMSARPSGRLSECLASDPVDNPARYGFRGYLLARAKEKYEALSNEMDAEGFKPTHVYSFWFYDTALVAAWIKEDYGCERAISRAHNYDLYKDRSKFGYLPFRRYLIEHLDRVLTCSADGHDYLDYTWPVLSDRFAVAYLGTRDLPDKSGEVREGPFRIVSCSRVVDTKRVWIIAEALKLLDERDIDIEWMHFGAGPELKDVVRRCGSLSTAKAVFAGSLPNSEVLGRYSCDHYDLFVNVSSKEGLPISIMEACGIGMPVVATDVGGTSEIVHDGVNGTLLKPDCTPEDVAEAIASYLFLSDEKYGGMRSASRQIWETDFRVKKNVEELASQLRR
jgi:glycosyltransferase involved in cell wall biosynthesis